ncbi:hypothetical protein Pelo_4502 [Pelomyxa schiedti]|nr:hypothetical protein Pelo_4502 [Pelomyxa schiedti]
MGGIDDAAIFRTSVGLGWREVHRADYGQISDAEFLQSLSSFDLKLSEQRADYNEFNDWLHKNFEAVSKATWSNEHKLLLFSIVESTSIPADPSSNLTSSGTGCSSHLAKFHHFSLLKLNHIVVSQVKLFRQMDVYCSGTITADELKALSILLDIPLSDEQIKRLHESIAYKS